MVGLDGVPIGPQWLKADGEFFLGADPNGRDIMVRLLYGGRNSLMIGVTAALMTTILSVILGVIAGYFRGWSDTVIRSVLDILWSFPVVILGVALGVALALGGLRSDRSRSRATRSAMPIFIIGLGLHPVHGETRARPGAVAAREGVRRGGARAGRGPAADHVQRGRAEPGVDGARVLHAPDRERGPARGGAVVPRRRRAAAEPVLGHDDRRRRRADRDRAAPDDRAGA